MFPTLRSKFSKRALAHGLYVHRIAYLISRALHQAGIMSPTIVQAVKMFGFLRIKGAQSEVSLQKSLLLDKPGNEENPIRYYGNSITTELSSVTDAFKALTKYKDKHGVQNWLPLCGNHDKQLKLCRVTVAKISFLVRSGLNGNPSTAFVLFFIQVLVSRSYLMKLIHTVGCM